MSRCKYSNYVGCNAKTCDSCDVNTVYEKGKTDAFNQKEDADGCVGCAFEDTDEWCLPCSKCKRNAKDYWRPKEQKNDNG